MGMEYGRITVEGIGCRGRPMQVRCQSKRMPQAPFLWYPLVAREERRRKSEYVGSNAVRPTAHRAHSGSQDERNESPRFGGPPSPCLSHDSPDPMGTATDVPTFLVACSSASDRRLDPRRTYGIPNAPLRQCCHNGCACHLNHLMSFHGNLSQTTVQGLRPVDHPAFSHAAALIRYMYIMTKFPSLLCRLHSVAINKTFTRATGRSRHWT
jgi:hypothetical protein